MANVKLKALKPNPDNPRLIKDVDFYKLVDNIVRFPRLLRKRPVVQLAGTVMAGNMRYRAIDHIAKMPATAFAELINKWGLDDDTIDIWEKVRSAKSIPGEWVADAGDLGKEELDALVILDNVSFGGWDYDMLANNWETDKVVSFGAVESSNWLAKRTKENDDADAFNDAGREPENKYAIMVVCDDEAHQEATFKKLQKQGYTCKVVVV